MKRIALRVSDIAIVDVRLMMPRAKRWSASFFLLFLPASAAGADALADHICRSAVAEGIFEAVSIAWIRARVSAEYGCAAFAASEVWLAATVEGVDTCASRPEFASAMPVKPALRMAEKMAMPRGRYNCSSFNACEVS